MSALTSPVPIDGGGLKRWIYYSPLHLPFLGTEAVMIFFMLSGFVLANAYPGFSALKVSYLLPRLMRLYIPIWGSLAFALLLLVARPASKPVLPSAWLGAHFDQISFAVLESQPMALVRDFFVLQGTSWLNSSLWSMRFEIAASISLVVFVAVGRFGLAGFIGSLLAAQIFKTTEFSWLTDYVPFFVAGIVISNSRFSMSISRANLVTLLGFLSLLVPWLALGLNLAPVGEPIILLTRLLGSACLILATVNKGYINRIFESPMAQYFGSRSYSLYLIHAPIVALAGFWVFSSVDGSRYWLLFVAPVAATAILAAELFYRLIEWPSITLARRLRGTLVTKSPRQLAAR
jgi:peptidoglycan/LPS O-acetylase OafA/YrhL